MGVVVFTSTASGEYHRLGQKSYSWIIGNLLKIYNITNAVGAERGRWSNC